MGFKPIVGLEVEHFSIALKAIFIVPLSFLEGVGYPRETMTLWSIFRSPSLYALKTIKMTSHIIRCSLDFVPLNWIRSLWMAPEWTLDFNFFTLKSNQFFSISKVQVSVLLFTKQILCIQFSKPYLFSVIWKIIISTLLFGLARKNFIWYESVTIRKKDSRLIIIKTKLIHVI